MKKLFKFSILLIILVLLIGCGKQKEKTPITAEITPVKYDRKAIVTIISDDGDYESGLIFNKLLKQNKLHATVAIFVNNAIPHLKEWQRIEKEGYIQLVSHSYTHVKISEEAILTEEELNHEIVDSKKYFEKNFVTDPISYVPSENSMIDKGYDILKANGIYAVRQGHRGLNSLSPSAGKEAGEWMNLLTYGIGDADTIEGKNAWVDNALLEKKWLIEMWHNVGKEGYQAMPEDLADEHLKYLAKKQEAEEIWVAPFTEAAEYIYEKQNSEVEASICGNKIKLEIICDKQKLPTKFFDKPLTIKIGLPEDWSTVKASQGFTYIPVIIKENDDRKYMLLEVTPNKGVVSIIKTNK